jgi:inner membrane protein
MDPVTHVATGLIISQLVPTPSRLGAAVAGVIFAVLPDLDYFLVAVDRLAFIRHHRGFTHSLIAIPLFALLGAGLGRALTGPRWFRPLFFLGLAVLASHLLLDLATSFGTQIFSPFSRRKVTLDWLFIIDPYLTLLLVAGAAAALWSPLWGRKAGAFFLAAAGGYLFICGLYHQQALTLAQQVFPETHLAGKPQNPRQTEIRLLNWQSFPQTPESIIVAALPQPFSCRRWQLIAAGPQGISQTFVELPYPAGLMKAVRVNQAGAAAIPVHQDCRVPAVPYQPPQDLQVHTWTRALPAPVELSQEAAQVLNTYLEFARFPLLYRAQVLGEEHLWEWLDLRFSVPGRAFPFVLQFYLDRGGRLRQWLIGRCQGEGR